MSKIKFLTIVIVSILVALSSLRIRTNAQESRTDMLKSDIITADPPSIQMYYYIEKYSQKYKIPRNYAYGIAHKETQYGGPFDWDYKPAQTSHSGAVGPMQVMVSTSKFINKETVTKEKLRTDIRYNVRTSMKTLRYLKNQYGDWKTALGCYNTGRPTVNQYALNVYNYQPKW